MFSTMLTKICSAGIGEIFLTVRLSMVCRDTEFFTRVPVLWAGAQRTTR